MLTNVGFDFKRRRADIAYCNYYAKSKCYITNSKYWRELLKENEDEAIFFLIATLCHEEIHLVLNKIESYKTSEELDNVKFDSKSWETAD